MSAVGKFLVRPKVRFSKSPDTECDSEELADSEEKEVQSNVPTVKSIISLKYPVKILDIKSADKDKLSNNARKGERLTEYKKVSKTVEAGQVLCDDYGDNANKNDSVLILNDTSNVQNTKANDGALEAARSNVPSHDKIKDIPPLLLQTVSNDKLNKTVKSQCKTGTGIAKDSTKTKYHKGKENQRPSSEKKISTLPTSKQETKKSSSSKIPLQKNKLHTNGTNTKLEVSKSKSLTAERVSTGGVKSIQPRRSTSGGIIKSNVMPCLKYKGKAQKTSPVEKTVLRDIVGSKIKSYVGPGVMHKKFDDLKVAKTLETDYNKPDVTCQEKLSKPEYNSIMCTINKLNEVKKEKIVTDVEHLPHPYKDLINGKISTALDFPLDEAIYKNLVDLSIDEKQLPGRLIRNKDPEPRQRDIVPKLADFFVPESNNEYCSAASIRPRTPETIDNYDAFKITKKISEWKNSMDS